MGIPILETKMRFQKKVSTELLQLDLDKYSSDGSQFHLKDSVLSKKAKKLHVCNEKGTGKCKDCLNCTKLMIDNRDANIKSQKPIFKKRLDDFKNKNKASKIQR